MFRWFKTVLIGCFVVFSLTSLGQEEERYTVTLNVFHPVSPRESLLFEEVLLTQMDFYLTRCMSWINGGIQLRDSPKKVKSELDEIVKSDVKFHKYTPLEGFNGFSNVVKMKLENTTEKRYDTEATSEVSEAELRKMHLNHQKSELLEIIRTELLVQAKKDVMEPQTKVISGLTKAEKDALLAEIKNHEEGSLLNSIELTYSTMPVQDDSGLFMGGVQSIDLADQILNLLAENAQKLERLESELSQLRMEQEGAGEGAVRVPSAVSESERQILDQLPSSMSFYFNKGSTQLTAATTLQLNELVEILARSKAINVVITGHADQSGDYTTNLDLSKKRAEAVKEFMVNSGMDGSRFITNYFGESKSASESNQDRRVEINFFLD